MPKQEMLAENWISKELAESLAAQIADRRGRHLLFQYRANRDWVAKLAKQRNPRTELVKRAIRNQQLDPRYTVEGSHMPDLGLGNDYKHFFASLYELDYQDRW